MSASRVWSWFMSSIIRVLSRATSASEPLLPALPAGLSSPAAPLVMSDSRALFGSLGGRGLMAAIAPTVAMPIECVRARRVPTVAMVAEARGSCGAREPERPSAPSCLKA